MKFLCLSKRQRLFVFFLIIRIRKKTDSLEKAIQQLIDIMSFVEKLFCPVYQKKMRVSSIQAWQQTSDGTFFYHRFHSHTVFISYQGDIEIYLRKQDDLFSLEEYRRISIPIIKK
jgi:hypothetical protein